LLRHILDTKLKRMKQAVQSLVPEISGFAGLLLGLALLVTSFLGPEWQMLGIPGLAFVFGGLLYGLR
jgi:hypothetical protein